MLFQSTHPRGVRLIFSFTILILSIRFNPRTRVGCDLLYNECYRDQDLVSIHAPAWGATSRRVPDAPQTVVSIHAPAWGATGEQRRKTEVACCFNPRTRVGCDAKVFRTLETSISFNPRTRVGCDKLLLMFIICLIEFQSTHPRGVRQDGIAGGSC